MAKDIEITIHQNDLGHAEPDFGLTEGDLRLFDVDGKIRVDVYIDGKSVEPKQKTGDSIVVKLPPGAADRTSTVTVVDDVGKILKLLKYKGDKKIKDPDDDALALLKTIGEASGKIAAALSTDQPLITAINNLTAAINTKIDPPRSAPNAGIDETNKQK
jgi:hypothetical protein